MKRIRSWVAVATTVFVLVAGMTTVGGGSADAATISGGDKGGADITVSNGDVLSGTFTNVGTFTIPAGVTVTVAPGVPLSVTAARIVIAGTLDGTAAGAAGGQPSPNANDPGNPGAGPGAGGGGGFGACVHSSGGGGGGYGGAGGDSALAAGGMSPSVRVVRRMELTAAQISRRGPGADLGVPNARATVYSARREARAAPRSPLSVRSP